MEGIMKIKLISINPNLLNQTKNNLLLLEKNINRNIKKIHDVQNECLDEIEIATQFDDSSDQEITNYINYLNKEAIDFEKKEKRAIKELKKIQKKIKYIDFIKKINY